MGVPWTVRRSNQSILKEISPEYSLEGLMLKLLIFWSPDTKKEKTLMLSPSLEKVLMLGEIEGREEGGYTG